MTPDFPDGEPIPSPPAPRRGKTPDDALDRAVGALVRAARESRGLTFRALAARCDLAPAWLCALEQGRTTISVRNLYRLAAALGVGPASLLPSPERTDPPSRSADR